MSTTSNFALARMVSLVLAGALGLSVIACSDDSTNTGTGGSDAGSAGGTTSTGGSGAGTGAGGSPSSGGSASGIVPAPSDGEVVELEDPTAQPLGRFILLTSSTGGVVADVAATFMSQPCTRLEEQGSCYVRRCDGTTEDGGDVTFSSPKASESVVGTFGTLDGEFAPGDAIHAVGVGNSSWPAFEADLILPVAIELTSPLSETEPGVDYRFTWTGGGDGQVVFTQRRDERGVTDIVDVLTCVFPASAGSATVPGAMLLAAGYPGLELAYATLQGVGGVTLKLSSARDL